MMIPQPAPEEVINRTRQWLEDMVIGLNLCPFAKAVHARNQIRYTVSSATTTEQLAGALVEELQYLHAANPAQIDTTLLIHPHVLTDFLQYNDFLNVADAIVDKVGLRGELQIASFHPDYQFADTTPNDVTNYTNRSPFPMLHLLRETSVENALATFPDAERIYERNIATMRRLGPAGLERYGMKVPCGHLLPSREPE